MIESHSDRLIDVGFISLEWLTGFYWALPSFIGFWWTWSVIFIDYSRVFLLGFCWAVLIELAFLFDLIDLFFFLRVPEGSSKGSRKLVEKNKQTKKRATKIKKKEKHRSVSFLRNGRRPKKNPKKPKTNRDCYRHNLPIHFVNNFFLKKNTSTKDWAVPRRRGCFFLFLEDNR